MPKKGKTGDKLTPREVTFIRNFIKTGNMTKAARAAGDNGPNAGQNGWSMMRRVRDKIGQHLSDHGITPDYLTEKILMPGLQAMKTEAYTHNGIVMETRDYIDHEQRGRYADRIYKLTGLYITTGQQPGTESMAPRITINMGFLDAREAKNVFVSAGKRLGGSGFRQLVVDAESDKDQRRTGPGKSI